MKSKILIVEDEADAMELIVFNVEAAGFQALKASTGKEALEMVAKHGPDLIILDLMLPGINGLEICKMLRRDSATVNIPIMILTAKAEEIDRVLGLELGADDYLTKPFSPRELVLRIRALLRRAHGTETSIEIIRIGELAIDIPKHRVMVGEDNVELTATEFNLLAVLAQRQGRVQSRDRLLQDVWNYDAAIDTRTVDTHVRRLREKLGSAAHYLDTVRGVGYRLIER